MQLNIYLLNHPIIQILSNNRTEENPSTYYLKSQQLSLFIIYEIVRKWIKTQTIYIKKINYIQNITITDKVNSYSIVTDLTKSHYITTAISSILPNINFIHTNYLRDIEIDKDSKKIIFFEESLCNYKVIEFLGYLYEHNKINKNDIKVACIICNNKILDLIGNKYPDLEIYTTRIIKS